MESKTYKCEKCEKQFTTVAAYGGHRSHCLGKVNLEERRAKIKKRFGKVLGEYLCDLCKKTFDNNQSYYGHKSHCGKPKGIRSQGDIDIVGEYLCLCGETFTTKRRMNAHSTRCPKNPVDFNTKKWKKTFYKGEYFDSTWETSLVDFFDAERIKWVRNRKFFNYSFNGKSHRYYPDFYLPEFSIYIEVKGWELEQDKYKYETLGNNLIVLKRKELKELHII